MRRAAPLLVLVSFASFAAVGCGDDRDLEGLGTIREAVKAPLAAAYCQINVNGVNKDTETDYLPHVITCENGDNGVAQVMSSFSYQAAAGST